MLTASPRNEVIKGVDAAPRLFGLGFPTPPPTGEESERYFYLRELRAWMDFEVSRRELCSNLGPMTL